MSRAKLEVPINKSKSDSLTGTFSLATTSTRGQLHSVCYNNQYCIYFSRLILNLDYGKVKACVKQKFVSRLKE